MKKVIVAGSTGYLGRFMIKALYESGYQVTALARKSERLRDLMPYIHNIVECELTKPETFKGIMEDAYLVFSSVGITRQKDDLTYMDVDYQCNMNLLQEALSNNVKKFMYIAALNGDRLKHLKIMAAKERFVDELTLSQIDSYVIRPSGFFSDMTDFFNMAKKGRALVFGHGLYKANPIHGIDLANYCVETLEQPPGIYPIGGPEILTQKDIANIAFNALDKPAKIARLPLWLVKLAQKTLVTFTKETYYGPIQFFMTVLTMDMVAPVYGEHTLGSYYGYLVENSPKT